MSLLRLLLPAAPTHRLRVTLPSATTPKARAGAAPTTAAAGPAQLVGYLMSRLASSMSAAYEVPSPAADTPAVEAAWASPMALAQVRASRARVLSAYLARSTPALTLLSLCRLRPRPLPSCAHYSALPVGATLYATPSWPRCPVA
jgi:hypothetical protein